MSKITKRLVQSVLASFRDTKIVVEEPITPTNRYDRLGTIFSRMTGLIKTQCIKKDEIPLFYHVYKTFPPKYEPVYMRAPIPNIKVINILYPEDKARAEFYKNVKGSERGHSITGQSSSPAQRFLMDYYEFKATSDPQKPEDDIIKEFSKAYNAKSGPGV